MILNGACISISNLQENIAWQTHKDDLRTEAQGSFKSRAWGGHPTCHPLISRVHITYITSNLGISQNLRVVPKLNIYINMLTPHAGPPEANHAKARLSKTSHTEGKALSRPKPTPGQPKQRIQPGTS